MESHQTPFPASWYGIDLPAYREIKFTYEQMSYDSLPRLPLDSFRGKFQWLPEVEQEHGCRETEQQARDWRDQFETLVVSASELGLRLPDSFLHYMRSDLRYRLRLTRGGYYRLPDRIESSPKGDGYLFLFLADSQDCLLWYLHLDPLSGDHCVVVSWDFFGCDIDAEPQYPEEPDNVFFCAPSFEAFIYRTWIENEIWLAWHEGRWPPPAEQLSYVEHYREPGDKSDRRPRCDIHGSPMLPGHELWLAPGQNIFSKHRKEFPNANAYSICGWRETEDKTINVVATGFCPICRKGLMTFLDENGFHDLLNRLRRHIEIE